MKKLLLICGIFILLSLFLPLSCIRMKTKESVETNISEQSNSNNPLSYLDFDIVEKYRQYDSVNPETSLSITIGKNRGPGFFGIERYRNLEKLWIILPETSDVDFSPLRSLPKLKNIEIRGWTITKLPDLSGIPSLTILFIDCTSLTNLNGLEKIPQLEYLSVTETFEPLTDTSALRYLKKLRKLIFWGGYYIINFNDLKDLKELEDVYIANCGELDLTGIGYLSKLKKLELMTRVSEETGKRGIIKNIEEIGRIKGLKELLIDDLLTSVEFLSNNTSLEYLELISGKDRNDYTKTLLPLDIAPLGNLKKLKRLTIRGSELKNKHVIDKLPELEVFNDALYDSE
jgi:internalin A